MSFVASHDITCGTTAVGCGGFATFGPSKQKAAHCRRFLSEAGTVTGVSRGPMLAAQVLKQQDRRPPGHFHLVHLAVSSRFAGRKTVVTCESELYQAG